MNRQSQGQTGGLLLALWATGALALQGCEGMGQKSLTIVSNGSKSSALSLSPTPSPTATPKPSPTATSTPTPIPTPSSTSKPSPTPTSTSTPAPSPTVAPSPTPSPSPTPTTASVTLAWDESSDSAVTGYRIYYGTNSMSYSDSVDAGLPAAAADGSVSFKVNNLSKGKTYYFAVIAYDASKAQSPQSNEVSKTLP